MSYNTRRSGGFGGNQQQSVSNVGQRRPVVTNNFVPGGQLTSQQKPVVQMPQPQPQQRPPQQAQQPSINFRNQQPQNPPPQPPQQQSPPQQPQPQPQGYNSQSSGKIEPPTPPKINQTIVANTSALDIKNGNDSMDTSTEGESSKKKPFWVNRLTKISKKERLRRRNLRLSKILQPKNAVMILNELIKNAAYTVEEVPVKVDPNQYKATVTFDGQSHVGLGRNKNAAKNSAAEAALKYLVKNKKLDLKKDDEGDVQMEVSDDGTGEATVLPWQHVASFALFKLFSSWGEDPNQTTRQAQELLGCPKAIEANAKQHENKPAKKMPPSPEKINPLMLVNQMLPHAQYEEVGKTGNPPNVAFSFKCSVDEQSFIGTGPNKKTAKKNAAFAACNKILGINYPPDVYTPIY